MKLSMKFGMAVVFIMALSLFLSSCVKVDNADVSTVDLRSTVQFVNLSNVGTATAIKVEGSQVASLTYGLASSYLDLAAGARNIVYTYGTHSDTLLKALPHDTKVGFFSICEPSIGDTSPVYTMLIERLTYSGTVAYPAGKALIHFVNYSRDTAATVLNGVEFKLFLADTVKSTTTAKTFGGATDYVQAAAADNPKFMVVGANSDTLVQKTAITTSQGRFAVIFFGAGTTLQAKVFQED